MHERPYSKRRVSFDSGGTACRGYLYLPSGAPANVPCVVMAHGFSATMDWIVPDFADVFASGGLAVLIFDYRHLGASGGRPRQLIDSRRQRDDLRRAIEFARSREGIDPNRIALWGTSLGGSHVVELAAADLRIAAVVANVPAIDVFRGGNYGAKARQARAGRRLVVEATARLVLAAIIDGLRGVLGLSPYYIKVYGRPGEAVFTDPSLADRFRTLAQNSRTWRNRVTPRFFFSAPRYREGTMERIRAPLLVTLARDDVELSSAFVTAKARKAPRAEVKVYPVTHFEMYHGSVFQQVAADQLAFLQRHLL